MRPLISIWGSVCPSVRPSITHFFRTAELEWKRQRHDRITIVVKIRNITCPLPIEEKNSKRNSKKNLINLCPSLWTHLCSNELVFETAEIEWKWHRINGCPKQVCFCFTKNWLFYGCTENSPVFCNELILIISSIFRMSFELEVFLKIFSTIC